MAHLENKHSPGSCTYNFKPCSKHNPPKVDLSHDSHVLYARAISTKAKWAGHGKFYDQALLLWSLWAGTVEDLILQAQEILKFLWSNVWKLAKGTSSLQSMIAQKNSRNSKSKKLNQFSLRYVMLVSLVFHYLKPDLARVVRDTGFSHQ